MKIEWWKYIPGYEGLYMASNLGRIRSLKRNTTSGKILKQSLDGSGYPQVTLSKLNKRITKKVHRLVALTWIPNPDNLQEIDHIDGNPKNNSVSNLKWCTHYENINNPICLKRRSVAFKDRPLSKETKRKLSLSHINGKLSKKVNQYTLDGELVKTWLSANEIYRQTGWSKSYIVECCNGKHKTAYGFKWSYFNDPPTIKQF